ncbi:MAG: putative secreted protein, partial [Paenibacillus sp.]|nr:putative secreted protein [Paenibacillus sp.]
MRRYRHLLLVGLVAALFAVWGCSDKSSTDPGSGNASSGTAGDTAGQAVATDLKYPLSQTIPTLDPHLSLGGSNATVVLNVFEGLFAFNSKYEPVPMLAESYELSADGKTYTFLLRKGVKFHNGKEMKAEDVAASLNRWKDKAARAKSSFGDSQFAVQDDYTVLLNLKNPQNDTLAQLSHVLNFAGIMPKEVIDSAAPEGVNAYIGTGPFKIVEWKKDQLVHVTLFEQYQSLKTAADGFSGKKEALVNYI